MLHAVRPQGSCLTINTDSLTEWEGHALLTLFLSLATQEQRRIVATTLPIAYNKLVGEEAMEVRQKRVDALALPERKHDNGHE